MHEDIAARLLALNRQFYQTFALQFSATRQRLQPGVRKILESVPPDAAILDLGCGNGGLVRELDRRGHSGPYMGLDFSPELLEEARKISLKNLSAEFLDADISSSRWSEMVSGFHPDLIFAFAVLHHLPGKENRRQVLERVHNLLAPPGSFIHSVWQFLDSARLRSRIQPWEAAGISNHQVETSDYLLDWRSGGHGLRYIHHFDEQELAALASNTGFRVVESFYSDGETGRLGLYQNWRPASPP